MGDDGQGVLELQSGRGIFQMPEAVARGGIIGAHSFQQPGGIAFIGVDGFEIMRFRHGESPLYKGLSPSRKATKEQIVNSKSIAAGGRKRLSRG